MPNRIACKCTTTRAYELLKAYEQSKIKQRLTPLTPLTHMNAFIKHTLKKFTI